MSNDISGFGLVANIRASVTFPAGFNVRQFADDADPLDSPSQQINDVGMGLNGDLVHWSTAQPLVITLNVIPNSDDDKNLYVLAEANRVGKGKVSAHDQITITLSYPDGTSRTLSNGVITDAILGNGVASAGRMKSKPYIFKFENQVIA